MLTILLVTAAIEAVLYLKLYLDKEGENDSNNSRVAYKARRGCAA